MAQDVPDTVVLFLNSPTLPTISLDDPPTTEEERSATCWKHLLEGALSDLEADEKSGPRRSVDWGRYAAILLVRCTDHPHSLVLLMT